MKVCFFFLPKILLQIYYISEFRYDFYYIESSPAGGNFRLFRDCFLFVCHFFQNLFSRQMNTFSAVQAAIKTGEA